MSVGSRPELAEVSLDRPHFRKVQGQLTFSTQFLQTGIVEIADGDGDGTKMIDAADTKMFGLNRPLNELLDRIVGQNLPKQQVAIGCRNLTASEITTKGSHTLQWNAQIAALHPERFGQRDPSRPA